MQLSHGPPIPPAQNVTIFGESAGGNSVINHLAQPASFPLYNKAIVESGAYDTGAANMSVAEASYGAVLVKGKCSSLSCLVAKSTKDLSGTSETRTGPRIRPSHASAAYCTALHCTALHCTAQHGRRRSP